MNALTIYTRKNFMTNKVFIIIPSFERTGPIKGAIALANILSRHYDITVVTLKNKKGIEGELDKSIDIKNLHSQKWNILFWIKKYREILKSAGASTQIISISMCFSADLVNAFSSKYSINIASVRANLIRDYRFNYGLVGYIFSLIHLLILFKFRSIISMSNEMANQIKKITKINSTIIGNFIDEARVKDSAILEKISKKTKIINFIFVGSLTKRKRPLLLAKAIKKIIKDGLEVNLTYVGDGPLRNTLSNYVNENNLKNNINLVGSKENPYSYILNSDYFVLPSESEGISRASLEALFLGIPCLLRNIDGNRELITDGHNGYLFENDFDLVDKMHLLINLKNKEKNESLIPEKFSISYVEKKYLSLINNLLDD